MPYGPHCFWGSGMWVVPLICLLVMVLVAAFFLFRRGCCGWPEGFHQPGGGAEDPLDILKGRYARGEITKEQFEQMKKDL